MTDKLRGAAQQALDALEKTGIEGTWELHEAAITALREALAEPAQEPYDQSALELCEECGWKTVIPDEGCLNCARLQNMKSAHDRRHCQSGGPDMTRDDIIKFATDAKFPIGFLLLANREDWKCLERFAALATAAAVAAEREACARVRRSHTRREVEWTRDDIIRMAREAGCGWTHNGTEPVLTGEIQMDSFAAFVEQHLILRGYRKCATGQHTSQFCGELEAAVAAEREACLDLCRAYASDDGTAQKIEAAIRARGEK